MTELDRLQRRLVAIRALLDLSFSKDTAYPGTWDRKVPSKGHCAAVSAILHSTSCTVRMRTPTPSLHGLAFEWPPSSSPGGA